MIDKENYFKWLGTIDQIFEPICASLSVPYENVFIFLVISSDKGIYPEPIFQLTTSTNPTP